MPGSRIPEVETAAEIPERRTIQAGRPGWRFWETVQRASETGAQINIPVGACLADSGIPTVLTTRTTGTTGAAGTSLVEARKSGEAGKTKRTGVALGVLAKAREAGKTRKLGSGAARQHGGNDGQQHDEAQSFAQKFHISLPFHVLRFGGSVTHLYASIFGVVQFFSASSFSPGFHDSGKIVFLRKKENQKRRNGGQDATGK